jgi:phospholipid/cholesterol/gamma-HCH transport system ATP-binding protein
MSRQTQCAIHMHDIVTRFGDNEVHRGINLCVRYGERMALVGGSGSGKTTLLREMIGLLRPSSGRVELFGQDLQGDDSQQAQRLRNRFGVLFQAGALFTDLNVFDNIALPLRELGMLDETMIAELVALKLQMVNLAPQVATLMSYELSGGMVKRVALARALSLEPEMLFLDEPTSGLDPIASETFVRLLNRLHQQLGFTLVMITHDVHSLPELCDRIAVLADGELVSLGSYAAVSAGEHPFVRDFFHGSSASRIAAGPGG